MKRATTLAACAVLFGGWVFGCASGGGTTEPDVTDDVVDEGGGEGEVGEAGEEGVVCTPTEEICDGLDNDCDGETDEDFDLESDPDNCGACNAVCRPDNATGGCTEGECGYVCNEGWVDLDGSPVNGCEYECTATATAESTDDGTCDDGLDNDCDGWADGDDSDCSPCVAERCNGLDDDCDGLTDEDFDIDFDAGNCGACGIVCPPREHAVAICVLAACAIRCESGYADLDGLASNGCEADCVPATRPDETACDGVDDDCDGLTDEDFVGTPCGEGLCRRTSICRLGREVPCTPRTPPASTDMTCDGVDDDCDGRTDEDGTCACVVDIDCNDDIECTVEVCVRGVCQYTAESWRCSDGNPCTGDETCDVTLGCVPGTPIDCGDGIGCTDDTCNPLSGTCSSSANHTRCTAPQICDPPRSPDATGCALPPACAADRDCDDHDQCNGIETCGLDLLCRAGTRVDCDDSVACTTDMCVPADGSCLHIPPDADSDTYPDAACSGTDCNDRDPGINPGAIDSCNGVDDNCDGVTDGGAYCGPLPHAATSSCVGGACVPNCDRGWGDCDGILANGCDTSLTTLTNCAACGVACDLPRATESCATGACRITSCDTPWADCNSIDADGCEASLTTLVNCGACGVGCSPAHATGATCITGACSFSGCDSGWGNCDGNGANGCERSLTSLTDCGSCGVPCDMANATETCTTGTCTLVSCNTNWGNCDGSPTNGCETSLATLLNCGACSTLCDLPNAVESCSGGTCTLVSCSSGWGNCDGSSTNGCERSLTTLSDCGACGTTCSPANASGATCSSGSCSFSSCNTGWGNCDGNNPNGCETSTRTLTDCGSCSISCDLPNATESCSTGTCTLVSCDTNYGNCDGNQANGCEAPLTTLTNCGNCGTACNPANAVGASCGSGSCTFTSCNSGWGNCDGNNPNGCETSLRTLIDCGSCGTSCDLPNATESCITGTCTLSSCNAGYGNCDGNPVNGCEAPLTTLTNCGACATACSPANATGATCATGTCSYASCNSGWGNCDGNPANGCETSLTTLTNCGACGSTCTRANATASCSTGTCTLGTCNSGWGNCDGNEANGCEASLTSLTNCGTCGTACNPANASGASCSSGSCTFSSCNSGWGNCDGNTPNGCETSLTSLTNCGSCGTTCSRANATASCATGTCTLVSCNAGWGNCDGNAANGCETSLTSLTNCGSCGTACSPANASGPTCASGFCSYASCNAGWGNCDGNSANGCETSLTTLTNCGSCGAACNLANATATCSTGICSIFSCNAGYGNCNGVTADGCEAPLTTLTNCGACATPCSPAHASGATCATGSCSYASCNAGWGNCDGNAANGCETSLTSLTNCGSCGTVCNPLNASGATCATGSCSYASCNAGWGNCDGVAANGCETSLTTLANCGSCGTTCSRANATATCASGTCAILSCNAGWANTDGVDSTGCECQMEALDAPNVCGSAYNMGTLTDPTGDQSVTGKITSASDVDCYYFYAADSPDTAYPSCDAFNVDIRFTANPSSQFQFTVYRANCSTVACSNEFDRYSWYTDFRSGSGTSAVGECFCTPTSRYDYNICNNNSAYYYFCVSRRSGFTPNCDAYTIRVTNGIF